MAGLESLRKGTDGTIRDMKKLIATLTLTAGLALGLASCEWPEHGTLCARGIPCPPEQPKPAYGPTRGSGGAPPTFPWNR